jgi:hypothetical protein
MMINLFMQWAVWPPRFADILVDFFICVALAWLLSLREEITCNFADIAEEIAAGRDITPCQIVPDAVTQRESMEAKMVLNPRPKLIDGQDETPQGNEENATGERDNPYDTVDL